jgi:signal transduction histidine kinase
MKTDFIATVSHELRTPLTSVLGFASLIQEKLEEAILPVIPADQPKAQKALRKTLENVNIIISESERLTTLINDVLDIAKMEAGRIEWNLQTVDPLPMFEQALAATSSLFTKTNLQLFKKFPHQLPEIIVDPDRLIQVIINLISNAVKFTEEGSVTCQVEVKSNELLISITDTGIGILETDYIKVFERFQQVGNILTNKPKGTGLGLPICKQIVEYHGGKIWIESKIGEGSTFFFTIPIPQKSSLNISNK